MGFCLSVSAQSNEFRALWVDAFGAGFKTAAQVTQLIADARAGHFNAIVVEVRKRGDAYYNSNFEPKATDISAGFDPLQDMITKAHDTSGGQQRIEVHAWIVAFPISQTATPPANHPMSLHPDWLTKNNSGSTFDGDNYLFDPGHPEVQKHTFNVAMDIISNYDVDGFNFDYIRYSGKAWGYNTNAIQRFNSIFNRSGLPTTTDSAWLQFRRDQVSALVRKVYLSAIALKPQVKISADTICFAPGVTTDAGWLSSSSAYTDKLQDWRGWMEEGILDLNIPMMYFDQEVWATAWTNWSIFAKTHRFNRHVAIGPAIYLNYISNSIVQIRSTRNLASGNRADGVSGYSYRVTNKDGVARSTFLAALTQTNTSVLYDPNPSPVFVDVVNPPTMPWKTAPTKGHLKGFVHHAGTSNGLDYAAVTLTGPVNKTMKTDATGFYGAVDLPPGNYTASASMPGYQGGTSNLTLTVGAVTTLDYYLDPTAAPTIINQPQNQTVALGGTALFTVSAAGNPAPGYQWRFNGLNISGATSSSYARSNIVGGDAGTYSVLVTNVFGSVPSSNATLTVVSFDSPPVLTSYPQSQIAIAGASPTLTASAQGTGPLMYQWQLNGTNLANATTTSLTLSNVQPSAAGDYTVIVSNNVGTDMSLPAAVSVHYALNLSVSGNGSVFKSPDLPSYAPNSSVTLTASTPQVFYGWSGSASGTSNPLLVSMNGNKTITATFTNDIVVDDAPLTPVGPWTLSSSTAGYYGSGYRFRGIGTGLNYVQFTPNLPAAGNYQVYTWYTVGGNRTTNAPHVITFNGGAQTVYVNQEVNGSQWVLLGTFNFLAGSSGHVRITDAFSDAGQVVMADAIRFLPVAVPPPQPPNILLQPQSRTITAGQSPVFSISAAGAGTLDYQWRHNGTNIPGGTGSAYTRNNAQSNHAGNYSVAVSNSAGLAISSNALLTVNVPVSIGTHPASQTNNQGTDASFSVVVSGTGLKYRWRFNGVDLPGQTNATLLRSSVQPEDAGAYSVVVFNVVGGIASSNALLSIRTPPVIESHPLERTANPGDLVTFNVSATGTAPLSYQWQRDATNIPGATSVAYTITNVQSIHAGTYRVVVTNEAGMDVSDSAALNVNSPPSITTQPVDQTVDAGGEVSFTAVAAGTEPLGYQWRFNEVQIAGATSATFVITNVQPSHAGSYSLLVTNDLGSAVSSNATLIVNQANVPLIETITLLPAGNVELKVSGGPGNFAIEAGPALANWTQLTTLSATGAVFYYVDPETNQASRFFRVRREP